MKKILVVDDDQVNLELFLILLNTDLPDYQVILSSSGKEAIKIATEQLPDTILLDIIMPVINGIQVCQILKEDPRTKNIPIIMVSALGRNLSDRLMALNAGADAFLAKPFDESELILQVKIMLRIKQAEDHLNEQNKSLKTFIKNQTQEFHDFKDRFFQISEFALKFFWETDSQGVFTYVSSSIENVLGYNNYEVVGDKSLDDLCNQMQGKKKGVLVSDFVLPQTKIVNEHSLCVHKNGTKIWLAFNGFPIFNNEQVFVGFRGACKDVTTHVKDEIIKKKNLKEIKAYQKKLKTLNYELTLAEEKERRKIAEYLHDGISQTLSFVNIKLTSLLNDEISEHTQKTILDTSDLVKDSIAKSRLLTYDLSPPILFERGLIPAIQWKLDQINEKYNLDTLLQVNNIVFEFNDDVKILLYRIICELLTNVTKHANANLINIEIVKQNKYFCISVKDNGKGFKYKQEKNLVKTRGFGLFSIHERLELIGGLLSISSEVGKGTEVIVKIPVNTE